MREVEFAVQKTLKAGYTVAEVHSDNAVVDLAATTQPLTRDTGCMRAALGRPRFVKAPDGQVVSVFARD